MPFDDPLNRDELIDQLKKLETVQHVINFINSIFPSWIVHRTPIYSSDYPMFSSNWDGMIRILREKLNSPSLKKEEIIIAKDIGINCALNEKILIRTFCEVLTRAGFCVRSDADFTVCPQCTAAIPTETFYSILKDLRFKHNIQIPDSYSPSCRQCV